MMAWPATDHFYPDFVAFLQCDVPPDTDRHKGIQSTDAWFRPRAALFVSAARNCKQTFILEVRGYLESAGLECCE
jgi:hypothetical protein